MADRPDNSDQPEEHDPEKHDIDPELLLESGRASAIQDLADQARSMADKAVGLQSATQAALSEQVRRWRRTTAFLAVAVLILGFMGFRQLTISEDNKVILQNVEILLEDVEQLLRFVEEVESEEGEVDPRLEEVFRAALETREAICASTDPGIARRCSELGG